MRIFIIGGDVTDQPSEEDRAALDQACWQIGRSVRASGHELVLCSPMPGSADLAVLRGMASDTSAEQQRIHIFYPETDKLRSQIEKVERELGLVITRMPSNPPENPDDAQGSPAWRYAWLLSQIRAMDDSHAVIAIGGKYERTAALLLNLAEGKQKPVLPVAFIGGAAKKSYDRLHGLLSARLGNDIAALREPASVGRLVELVERVASSAGGQQAGRRKYFISYPRARNSEADFVETLLHRLNLEVMRDETDFGPGHDIPNSIVNAIHSADVFIVLWCREYACSPYCFDEFDLALSLRAKLELWILCLDDTRIVPPRARTLVNYPVRSREELAGRLVTLLGRTV